MLEVIILILTVLTNTLLGLAVFVKNPKRDLNRLFFFLTVSLSVWLLATYFSLNPVFFTQLVWVRFVLAAAAVLCYFVLMSFAIFPDGSLKDIKYARPATYYLLFVVLLVQTPFVFKTLTYNFSGDAQPVVAPGIVFFMILALSYLGGAVFLLFRKFRRAKGRIKNQLRIVIFGLATSFTGILITNLFLVSFFKNISLIVFAPLLTLILTGSMAYAILKHKLFDLRLAVARAMAYLLTFGLVILVYSGLAFLVGEVLSVSSSSLSTSQRLFYVSLAVLTALAFQPLKKFFDRATNTIFYRDAYDSQELLNTLNRSLVTTIELEELLKNSADIVGKTLKTEYCTFAIMNPDGHDLRFIGTSGVSFDGQVIGYIAAAVADEKARTFVYDEMAPEKHHLRDLMLSANIAVFTKLQGRSRGHAQRPGYILVGPKRSGGLFSSQDIRLLGIIADELVIAIQNALRFEEIRRFNITLQKKIEEATRELRRANSRLREIDKAKDEFISMASHQLRTPLTAVKGYLSMVLEGDAGPVKKNQKELIQRGFDGAQKMVYLIADMLNVSRLQTGKFVIENQPTKLAEIIEGEVNQLQEQADSKQITLTYQKPDKFPTLNLDETKIRQVIMNFLDNALYYTPSGGKIDARLEATEDAVNFTVTDTGVGVPKSVQHHLFSKFYRAENAKKLRPDGTGLGLYMVKKVVIAQGGAIIFKSIEGKGSTFGFSFPRKGTEAKAESAAEKK